MIGVEGGYVNDPMDRGGETKFGISRRAYPDLDIRNLTLEGAMAIYRQDYWERLKLGAVESQAIAEELFDTGVNCGVSVAGRFLQEALNLVEDSSLVVDGIIGARTICTLQLCRYRQALLKAMNGLQFNHYYSNVKSSPGQKRFFRGWLKRVWEN